MEDSFSLMRKFTNYIKDKGLEAIDRRDKATIRNDVNGYTYWDEEKVKYMMVQGVLRDFLTEECRKLGYTDAVINEIFKGGKT